MPPLPRLQNGALWRDVSRPLLEIPGGLAGRPWPERWEDLCEGGKGWVQAGQGSPEAAFVDLLRGCEALPPSSDTGIRWWLWQSLWSPALRGLGMLR